MQKFVLYEKRDGVEICTQFPKIDQKYVTSNFSTLKKDRAVRVSYSVLYSSCPVFDKN